MLDPSFEKVDMRMCTIRFAMSMPNNKTYQKITSAITEDPSTLSFESIDREDTMCARCHERFIYVAFKNHFPYCRSCYETLKREDDPTYEDDNHIRIAHTIKDSGEVYLLVTDELLSQLRVETSRSPSPN